MVVNFPYKRVLLKLSGEKLMGNETFGISQEACQKVATALKDLHNQGVEIALVIGGGNIFRGVQANALGLQQTPADHIGMLATLINGIALREALVAEDLETRLLSAIECPRIAEAYVWQKTIDYLQRGKIVIFAGGTGNPYFTTDTAAAMRACEIKADILLKGTKVEGVYDKDPMKYPDATRYNTITYSQVLAKNLAVMDATAVALCREHGVPIFVFKMSFEQTLTEILTGKMGTTVQSGQQ